MGGGRKEEESERGGGEGGTRLPPVGKLSSKTKRSKTSKKGQQRDEVKRL